ncbi:ASCH domain-containing protein [Ruminococcus flavefaciens]|uniref:ASCH domain-containing protein n=1 Tax=Ruminococcus flavefaciens TaxID=1265 RepID=UPI0026EDBA0E|nr:ASCH domain-containing protein [Ruminococcus flavefaciens]
MMILTIKKQWFDMLLSGEKKEEYRDIKPYYTSRLINIGLLDKAEKPTKSSTWVIFRNGYSKNSPTFKALCMLDVKQGKTEWGAAPDTMYYTLKIKAIENGC